MCAAIWSTPPSTCAQSTPLISNLGCTHNPTAFTARSLLRFMHNHHLLQIIGKPDWLTIKGGRFAHLLCVYLMPVDVALVSNTSNG